MKKNAREYLPSLIPVVELGIQHEQQHQELILTDIKHVLSCNPLHPVYREQMAPAQATAAPLSWKQSPSGIYWIGHGGEGFAFDNEAPRHRILVEAFELATRLVTNGKFMCSQYVLRGGSCATPRPHMRPTYRNFFPSEARRQFSGIRLCR